MLHGFTSVFILTRRLRLFGLCFFSQHTRLFLARQLLFWLFIAMRSTIKHRSSPSSWGRTHSPNSRYLLLYLQDHCSRSSMTYLFFPPVFRYHSHRNLVPWNCRWVPCLGWFLWFFSSTLRWIDVALNFSWLISWQWGHFHPSCLCSCSK